MGHGLVSLQPWSNFNIKIESTNLDAGSIPFPIGYPQWCHKINQIATSPISPSASTRRPTTSGSSALRPCRDTKQRPSNPLPCPWPMQDPRTRRRDHQSRTGRSVQVRSPRVPRQRAIRPPVCARPLCTASVTRRASRFLVGHEAYGTVVRLGTSFAHTSDGKPTGASKAWGAPRAYSDLKPDDKVRGSNNIVRSWYLWYLRESRSCRCSRRAAWNARRPLSIDDGAPQHLTSPSSRMCLRGFTSRCPTSNLLGSPTLPGAQAQYIRIPNAGGSDPCRCIDSAAAATHTGPIARGQAPA
jgi:hypothetical protein